MTEVREKYEKNNVDGLNFDFSPMDIYDKKKWFLEALTNEQYKNKLLGLVENMDDEEAISETILEYIE